MTNPNEQETVVTDALIAYHGKPELKAEVMGKIGAHRLADEIAKGAYVRTGVNPQYCAVGCVLEDPNGGHMRYESEFGIPAQLAYLEDGIFENLPDELAVPWPERFMGAIPVGADLAKVWPQFAVWLMVDPEWGVVNVAESGLRIAVDRMWIRPGVRDTEQEHEPQSVEVGEKKPNTTTPPVEQPQEDKRRFIEDDSSHYFNATVRMRERAERAESQLQEAQAALDQAVTMANDLGGEVAKTEEQLQEALDLLERILAPAALLNAPIAIKRDARRILRKHGRIQ